MSKRPWWYWFIVDHWIFALRGKYCPHSPCGGGGNIPTEGVTQRTVEIAPPAPTEELKDFVYAIWWVPESAFKAMPELPEFTESGRPIPEYIKKQYESLRGRAGRCRLWLAPNFEPVEINPWPNTPLTRWLEQESCGGICLGDDYDVVMDLPGILTTPDSQLWRKA